MLCSPPVRILLVEMSFDSRVPLDRERAIRGTSADRLGMFKVSEIAANVALATPILAAVCNFRHRHPLKFAVIWRY